MPFLYVFWISFFRKKNINIGNHLGCPTFFVDSPEELEDEMDNNTKEEINRLIVWASSLKPLDVQKTKDVDPSVQKEEIEEKEDIIDEITDMKRLIKTIIMGKYKRKKQFHYNGEITFTDWEKIAQYNKEEKIKKEVVKTNNVEKYDIISSEKRITVAAPEKTGFWGRLFGDYETKDIYIPCSEVKSKTVRQIVYNNGEVEEIP